MFPTVSIFFLKSVPNLYNGSCHNTSLVECFLYAGAFSKQLGYYLFSHHSTLKRWGHFLFFLFLQIKLGVVDAK